MPLLRLSGRFILLMLWLYFLPRLIAFPTDLVAARTEALFWNSRATQNKCPLRLDRGCLYGRRWAISWWGKN